MFTLWSASRAANLSREPRPPVSVFPLHRRLPSFWPSPLNFKRLSPLWEKSFSQDTGCPLGVIKEGCERRIASSLCGGKVFCFFHMFCEINIVISACYPVSHTSLELVYLLFFCCKSTPTSLFIRHIFSIWSEAENCKHKQHPTMQMLWAARTQSYSSWLRSLRNLI